MRLNDHQRQLLFRASSKNIENKNLSPLALARKIDAVVAKLHQDNPTAFITTVQEDLNGDTYFKGIDKLLKDREFYDEPVSINYALYRSYVRPHKRRL
jgi:hypothetical protein